MDFSLGGDGARDSRVRECSRIRPLGDLDRVRDRESWTRREAMNGCKAGVIVKSQLLSTDLRETGESLEQEEYC